jgi:hypothetical protein
METNTCALKERRTRRPDEVHCSCHNRPSSVSELLMLSSVHYSKAVGPLHRRTLTWAVATSWTGMPACASHWQEPNTSHTSCLARLRRTWYQALTHFDTSCVYRAEYQSFATPNTLNTTVLPLRAYNCKWMKLIGSRGHVTVGAQMRPKLSRHRSCRAFQLPWRIPTSVPRSQLPVTLTHKR